MNFYQTHWSMLDVGKTSFTGKEFIQSVKFFDLPASCVSVKIGREKTKHTIREEYVDIRVGRFLGLTQTGIAKPGTPKAKQGRKMAKIKQLSNSCKDSKAICWKIPQLLNKMNFRLWNPFQKIREHDSFNLTVLFFCWLRWVGFEGYLWKTIYFSKRRLLLLKNGS